MGKAVGILLSGIFVGAVGVEICHRKYPKGMKKTCDSVKKMKTNLAKSFKDGYKNATEKTVAAFR
ncbi:MAG: hypothetical protein HQL32_09620 [Planctomycetes bacterium]|nr:hypothetical protein [Planctomycetota bacterium]